MRNTMPATDVPVIDLRTAMSGSMRWKRFSNSCPSSIWSLLSADRNSWNRSSNEATDVAATRALFVGDPLGVFQGIVEFSVHQHGSTVAQCMTGSQSIAGQTTNRFNPRPSRRKGATAWL